MPKHSAPADQPGRALDEGRHLSRELLTAWLLLLLDREASHGYDLRAQLAAHGASTESGAMYRTLRKLEDSGLTASSWEQSDAGPRRRQYRVTAKGQAALRDLAHAIGEKRDGHAAFLAAHEGHGQAKPNSASSASVSAAPLASATR